MQMYDHQAETANFVLASPRTFITSDCGTGKTRSVLEAIKERDDDGKVLIFAPKSILKPAWGNDILKFTPELSFVIANANNRVRAFNQDVKIYITNIDAAKWVSENVDLSDFSTLVVDESSQIKHRTSARSMSLAAIRKHFDYRILMTGTPNSNTILDLWHQVFILDDGARLGKNFFAFRQSVCSPQIKQLASGSFTQWFDKDEAIDAVGDLIRDITIRHKFDDCLDIPPNSVRTVETELSPKLRKQYDNLKADAIIKLNNTVITAVHAAALMTKLLQLTSGAVYDSEHVQQLISTERYELINQMILEREHTLVAFQWTHQRDELIKLAKKEKISYAVIDGTVNNERRTQVVDDFQAGKYQVLYLHPRAAGHGLTLTRATTTIWASPTHNLEHFVQLNHRFYRAGQTKKTETILITATDTLEEGVYDKLQNKSLKMTSLLEIL